MSKEQKITMPDDFPKMGTPSLLEIQMAQDKLHSALDALFKRVAYWAPEMVGPAHREIQDVLKAYNDFLKLDAK